MAHMTKKDIREGDGNKSLQVKYQKEIAIRELDLMHQAIDAGEYKKAIHHKKVANVAIDEMVGVSKMVEE
jgi:hypothetical protein